MLSSLLNRVFDFLHGESAGLKIVIQPSSLDLTSVFVFSGLSARGQIQSVLEAVPMRAVLAVMDPKAATDKAKSAVSPDTFKRLKIVIGKLKGVKEFNQGRGFRATYNTVRSSLLSDQFLRSVEKKRMSPALMVFKNFEKLVAGLQELADNKKFGPDCVDDGVQGKNF